MWKSIILPEKLSLPHCNICSSICIDISDISMVEYWCIKSFHHNGIYTTPPSKIDATIIDIDSRCVCQQKMLVFLASHHSWDNTVIRMCRCGYWINSTVYNRRYGTVVPNNLGSSADITEDYRRWYNEHDN